MTNQSNILLAVKNIEKFYLKPPSWASWFSGNRLHVDPPVKAVDGVSLVSTYRGSFATQIKKNGFDSLLQELADKNSKLAGSIAN